MVATTVVGWQPSDGSDLTRSALQCRGD